MSNIACLYLVNDYFSRWHIKSYYERQTRNGEIIPLLADGVAYIEEREDKYYIRNNFDELLFIVSDESQLFSEISKLKAKLALINGVEILDYFKKKDEERKNADFLK